VRVEDVQTVAGVLVVGWVGICVCGGVVLLMRAALLKLLEWKPGERPAPPPSPPPTLDEKFVALQEAHRAELAVIDRLPLTDEEKQQLKAVAERRFLKNVEKLLWR
jgi:hypothetical protein